MTTTLMAALVALSPMTGFSNVASANQPLKIIIPAGSTGSFNARFEILRPEIEKIWGGNVKLIYGKNCTLAKKLIDAESGPVLTIWMPSENINPRCNMPIEKQNLIAIETDGLRFCTSNSTGLTAKDLLRPGTSYTIGITNPHNEYVRWLNGLNKAAKINLRGVPFGSSGLARRGLLAGDVDFVLISPSNSNKLMKSGGKCFFTTLATDEKKWNLRALKNVVDYDRAVFPQGYFYAGYNMSDDQLSKLRALYSDVAEGNNETFNKFASGKDIKMRGIKTTSVDAMKKIMIDIYNKWKK